MFISVPVDKFCRKTLDKCFEMCIMGEENIYQNYGQQNPSHHCYRGHTNIADFADLGNWPALPEKAKIVCQKFGQSNKGGLKKSSLFGLSAERDSAAGPNGL